MAVQGQPQNVREFQSGIFGCFDDCAGCVYGYFCGVCLMCSITNRLNESCCVPFFLQGGIMALRTKLRVQYGIRGTICSDWFATACFTPCAICQMDRELKAVGL